MIDLANSRSLTDFQRKARSYLAGVNETHEPLLLTVNGQVQAVVIDPKTFQAFDDFLEHQKFIAALEEGLRDVEEGRTQSLDDVKAELKASYGL